MNQMLNKIFALLAIVVTAISAVVVGFGAIALSFYVLSGTSHAGGLLANTPGQSIEEPKSEYNTQQMIKQDIPVYCGETSFVFNISSKSMEESQILIGEVRLEGSGVGDVVGILSFGHNAKNNTGTFFITIPDGGINNESVSCVLGYGMNWKFFDNDGNQLIRQNSLIEIGPNITQD